MIVLHLHSSINELSLCDPIAGLGAIKAIDSDIFASDKCYVLAFIAASILLSNID